MCMIKKFIPIILFTAIAVVSFSFKENPSDRYKSYYKEKLEGLDNSLNQLRVIIKKANISDTVAVKKIQYQLQLARRSMKGVDFWLRYLEPTTYIKINGPLPVEWENEVFEKYEQPYKRVGAGLTLATQYLDESDVNNDSLLHLIDEAILASKVYVADSITKNIITQDHFFLCNRLYLLNLAAIYTTGFECPDTALIIPELKGMMSAVNDIYKNYDESFTATPLSDEYLQLYNKAIDFINNQPASYSCFDHYTFIKDYVNPLFGLNQKFIRTYRVISHSLVDYSLTKTSNSIFDKTLYNGQNPKGIFLRVDDEQTLAEIENLGRQLFYDPILSGNNERSCISCHKPEQYFTDTALPTSMQYDHTTYLARNTPTLLNAQYNHLIMLDGKHISLQNQAKAVITNPNELGCAEKDVIKKILGCKEYNRELKKLLKYTPQEKDITFEHVASAITYYYSKFSKYYSPFDDAMNKNIPISNTAQKGFNLFMGKAQCGTCHFVPQFNGVKPPYISSEFEVLGVPQDVLYKHLSSDKGRYDVNPAPETEHAFRTGTIRNVANTGPYMHNGVFKTLNEVIDFYDAGGGAGRGLKVTNQTLASDSLKLSADDKQCLIAFIQSLNEKIEFEKPPVSLPLSKSKALNTRRVGGIY